MKVKLNTATGLLTVFLYFVGSIGLAILAAIFLGGVNRPPAEINVETVIDSGMVANLIMAVLVLFVSLFVFKDSRRGIFFERIPFSLSRLYYAIPLLELGIVLFVLLNVQYTSFTARTIALVLVASLAIGINEEIVTRGILLVGLRNDKVDEWKVYAVTLIVFTLLHLINVFGGGNLAEVLYQFVGGTIFYVTRRVFNTLLASIALHALYDTAFYLLPGPYRVGESLPGTVLDIQLGVVLVLFFVFILFLIFGRGLLKNSTTGWQQG